MLWNKVVFGHAPAQSQTGISIHPLGSFVSDRDVEQHALGTALPLDEQSLSVSDPPVSGNSSPEEDDLASSVQRLSIAETELRLVQRDMARVLDLPAEKTDDSPVERRSFKRRTGPAPRSGNIFPAMPLDRICTDRIEGIMSASSLIAYPKRADSYYRFPAGDFDKYFSTLVLPDSRVRQTGRGQGVNLLQTSLCRQSAGGKWRR